MSTTSISSQQRLSQATWSALAVLLLTSVHHVYGAFIYHTPWRLHVAPVAGLTAAALVGILLVLRRHTDDVAGHIAFWAFVGITLVIPVAGIGFFEGGYNHALKNALYFAGARTSLMVRLFPPPTYELPNDAFFEITGVMQAFLGAVTCWLLYRVVQSRLGASTPSILIPTVRRRA
jgi:hypothetical protein